jgi:CRISPR-associated RAMP protein (TIGR02581 family)
MYHRFLNRVEIRAKLVVQTGLHIGAGQESFQPLAIQGALMKDNRRRPFIPGSSIKGVLRSFLESVQHILEPQQAQDTDLSSSQLQEQPLVACDHSAEQSEGLKVTQKGDRAKYIQHLSEIYPEASKNELEARFAEKVEKASCIACQLFGSPVLAGRVKCADAVLASPEDWLATEIRASNAIEPDTHTAKAGALFDTEVIPSGTEFNFRVIAENLDSNQAQYLGEVLSFFAQGEISLGGRIRAGLGHVVLRDINLKVSVPVKNHLLPVQTDFGDVAPNKIADVIAEALQEKGDKGAAGNV